MSRHRLGVAVAGNTEGIGAAMGGNHATGINPAYLLKAMAIGVLNGFFLECFRKAMGAAQPQQFAVQVAVVEVVVHELEHRFAHLATVFFASFDVAVLVQDNFRMNVKNIANVVTNNLCFFIFCINLLVHFGAFKRNVLLLSS